MGTMGKTIQGTMFRPLTLASHEVTLSLADAPEFAGAGDVIGSPRDARRIAGAVIGNRAAESVLVLLLDARHRVTGYAEIARGAVNAARLELGGRSVSARIDRGRGRRHHCPQSPERSRVAEQG